MQLFYVKRFIFLSYFVFFISSFYCNTLKEVIGLHLLYFVALANLWHWSFFASKTVKNFDMPKKKLARLAIFASLVKMLVIGVALVVAVKLLKERVLIALIDYSVIIVLLAFCRRKKVEQNSM